MKLQELTKLVSQIKSVLSVNLKRPEFRKQVHPMAGHCYAATEALYHLWGKKNKFFPYRVMVHGVAHWYLGNRNNDIIIDITEGQFSKLVPHESARRQSFLTKKPSRRAKEIMRRLKVKF